MYLLYGFCNALKIFFCTKPFSSSEQKHVKAHFIKKKNRIEIPSLMKVDDKPVTTFCQNLLFTFSCCMETRSQKSPKKCWNPLLKLIF